MCSVRRRRVCVAGGAFSLKQQCCPHCGRRGTLNRHSRLLGNDPDRADGQCGRGQRVYCSNRGRRGGCGGTCAIFFGGVLPRHSVTASLLARLLVGLLNGGTVKAAAEALHSAFALETFYALLRRLRRQLDRVRTWLRREKPEPASEHRDPLLQTVEHLRSVFPSSTGAVAFQLRFQRAFLP